MEDLTIKTPTCDDLLQEELGEPVHRTGTVGIRGMRDDSPDAGAYPAGSFPGVFRIECANDLCGWARYGPAGSVSLQRASDGWISCPQCGCRAEAPHETLEEH